MYISILVSEISEAPPAVQDWFAQKQTASALVNEPEQKNEGPDPVHVLEKATEFLKAKGEDALQAVLKKVGIKRVGECPPEKLAEL